MANTKNLERISEKKFKTYEDAVTAKNAQVSGRVSDGKPAPAKVKIFARYDGTYDVVVYEKIQTPGQKVVKALEEAVAANTNGPAPKIRRPKKAVKSK